MINLNIMLYQLNTISAAIIGILKIYKNIVTIRLMLKDYKNIRNWLINEKNIFYSFIPTY